MSNQEIFRRLVGEFVGTAMLLIAVVGSGIMGERLAGGNIALALLANSLATGAALVSLILMFAGTSGAHFNPVVSLSAVMSGDMERSVALWYSFSQLCGAVSGVVIANLMFDLDPLATSVRVRTGMGQWIGEVVAASGLVGVIICASRRYSIPVVALAVASYITGAYLFTSSTSFANPAVTVARSFTDSFTGIRPTDVPAFVIAQVIGAIGATYLFNWLIPKNRNG